MNYNYVYLTLFICIVLIYVVRVGNNMEQFGQLNLPTFNKFIKYTRGYQCQEKIDAMPKWATDKYGKKSFCQRYPSSLDLAKISTVLVPKAVEIKKWPLVKMDANKLNVRQVPTETVIRGKTSSRISSAPIVEKKNLLKTEAIELLKREPKYHYIAVGKGHKMGETIFYAGDLNQIKGKEVRDYKYDLYEKVSSVEYSVSTWIKINRTQGSWRNIIHHGDKQSTRAPGLWIYPNDTKLGLAILHDKRKSWGEWIAFGGRSELPLGKWVHVCVAVSKRNVNCYVNGKKLAERTMGGNAIWPSNQKMYVARWGGNFHLSKTTWYPFALTEAYVYDMVFSTKPVPDFGFKDLGGIDSKPKATLLGSWKSHKSNPLTIKEKGGLIFIDGAIYNTSNNINQPCFILEDKFKPDRTMKFLVHGSRSSWVNKNRVVQGDTYLLTIKSNGEVTLTDKRKSKARGEYTRGIKVELSSVRFVLNKGMPFSLSRGAKGSTESSHPGITKIGSYLALSGHLTNARWGKIARLPSNLRTVETTLTTGVSTEGVAVRMDFYTWGAVKFLPQNDKSIRNCYLDGILVNTLRGEKIPLYNGFRNYHSWWTEAKVMKDNGIVKFSGLIGMPGWRGPVGWSIRNKGCFRDSRRRDLPKYHGYTHDKKSCARAAHTAGHNMFGLQWYGQCFSGTSYGKYGRSNNCKTPCHYKNKKENCGGGWANRVYQIGDTWHHMGRVPKEYAPNRDMRFKVEGNWRKGFIEVLIRKNGHMYMMSKQVAGWGRWNHLHLNRICYLKD